MSPAVSHPVRHHVCSCGDESWIGGTEPEPLIADFIERHQARGHQVAERPVREPRARAQGRRV